MGANITLDIEQMGDKVSIHAPVMGAKSNRRALTFILCFNPRTRDGCEAPTNQLDGLKLRFNPRTRDGCEGMDDAQYYDALVSIHAPVMGANFYSQLWPYRRLVSIHAPVMGAKYFEIAFWTGMRFNPRTRDGCESRWQGSVTVWLCFNPRTRDGCEGFKLSYS